MELITFIITILGFVIAVITFKNTFKEPKENISFLIDKYDNAEKATKKLINELKVYTHTHSSYNEHFKEGLTFQQGILFLENAYSMLFTQENRQPFVNSSIGKKHLDELIKRIDIHRDNIESIQTHLNFFFKRDFTVKQLS